MPVAWEKNRMSDKLDAFVSQMQNQIDEDARRAYGEVVFQRWLAPLYMERMEAPDGYGRVTGSCGDTMEIFLRFQEGRVVQGAFQTDGCLASIVCGSYSAELALGKDPDELTEITGERVLQAIGGLPDEETHCAFLAAESLQEAVDHYMKKQHPSERGARGV